MTLVDVATTLQEVEPLPDALEQLVGAEQLDPRRRELDRERQPVEAMDQLVDRRVNRRRRHGLPALARRRGLPPRGSSSGGRSNSTSPPIRSGSRLVTRIRSAGRLCEQIRQRLGDGGQKLFEVVEEDECLLVAYPRGDRGCGVTGRTEMLGDERHDEGRNAHGVRVGRRPCRRSTRRPETARARSTSRVLPVPPGPTIVRTRGRRSSQMRPASRSSRSRPRKRVAGVGRSTAPGVRSGGKLVVPSWNSCAGASKSLSRCRPRSAKRLALDECRGRGCEKHLAAVRKRSDARSRWTSIPT